jgi:sugar lactone lactonase YvrE
LKAKLLFDAQCTLAESPTWLVEKATYLWVDIEKGHLFSLKHDEKGVKKWYFPHRLTLVVPGIKGDYILALDGKIARFDPESEKFTWLCDLEPGKPENRCNDGACDRDGRLWVGTMSTKFTDHAGALYCIEKDMTVNKKVDKVSISNGICWSLDHKTMYFIDSPTREIKAYDYDLATGNIKFNKVAVKIPESLGSPDGMCMDENGKLWVAHYGGSGVYQWDPESGSQLDKIDVPAPHVTSCAFGGKDLNQLLITTAQENMTPEMLETYPLSGGVFICEMPVKGAEVFGAGF